MVSYNPRCEVKVSEVHTLRIAGKHGCHRGSRKQGHGVCSRVEELAILTALTPRPRSTNDKDVSGGASSLSLITARDVHDLNNISTISVNDISWHKS